MTAGGSIQQVRVDFITRLHGQGVQQFNRELNSLAGNTQAAATKAGQSMGRFARFSQAAGTALMVGMGAALAVGIKASIDFEDAFAGVRKTVVASEPEFQRLAKNIRDMSLDMPISALELARIGELGGQLGIPIEAMESFIDTIAKLGIATTLQTEEAAIALARFATVMGTSQQDFDRIGSSIVDLGNNFAATEPEIVRFATRLAGIGSVVGMTEGEVLGLATAFIGMGEPAERGATAVQRTLIAMMTAVQDSNAQLTVFADTAGMAADEFQELFREDPAEAFVAFSRGLGRINDEGGDVIAVLREVGLVNQRNITLLLKAATGHDQLAAGIARGNRAFQENIAMQEEAEKRFETTASQIAMLGNKFFDLRVEIGDRALPVVRDIIQFFGAFLDVIKDNIEVVATLGGLIAILAGAKGFLWLAGSIGKALIPLWEMLGVTKLLKGTFGVLTTGISIFGGVLGIAAIALIGIGLTMANHRRHVNNYNDAIGRLSETMQGLDQGVGTVQDVVDNLKEAVETKRGVFDSPPELEKFRDTIMEISNLSLDQLFRMAIEDYDEFERRTGQVTKRLQDQQQEIQDRLTTMGDRPGAEDVEAFEARNRVLEDWLNILGRIRHATEAEREAAARARIEAAREQRLPAPFGIGPIDTEAAQIARDQMLEGLLQSSEEYREGLANIREDTAQFGIDFANEWNKIIEDYNANMFNWSQAWEGYERVVASSVADVQQSMENWVADQRMLTSALETVFSEFGIEVGALFAQLPMDIQMDIAATLEHMGPEAFKAKMDTLVDAWGELTVEGIARALIRAPEGARRGIEALEDFFENEVAPRLGELGAEGSEAWLNGLEELFFDLPLILAMHSPEMADAFDQMMAEAVAQMDFDHDILNLALLAERLSGPDKLQFWRNQGFSWAEAIALAFADRLPSRLGAAAAQAANRVKARFEQGIEIRSPSRVFAEYGNMAAVGFAQGFAQATSRLNFSPRSPNVSVSVNAPPQSASGPEVHFHGDINAPKDDLVRDLQRATLLVGLTRFAEVAPGRS